MKNSEDLTKMALRHGVVAIGLIIFLTLTARAASMETMRFDLGGNFQKRHLESIKKAPSAIGGPLLEVLGNNTSDPLGTRINLRVNGTSLKVFLETISDAVDAKFVIPPDLPTAFMIVAHWENTTARQGVQSTLEFHGLTYRETDQRHTYLIITDPMQTRIHLRLINVSLRKYLSKVAQQANLSFRIAPGTTKHKITVKLRDVTALTAIDKLLEETRLSRRRKDDGRSFVIYKAK